MIQTSRSVGSVGVGWRAKSREGSSSRTPAHMVRIVAAAIERSRRHARCE